MTTPDTLPRPLVVRSGEGRTFTAGVDRVDFKLSGDDTGGAFALGLVTARPGGGPPPHRHRREDELFIVLTGRLEAWTPSGWSEAGPGDVVFLPAGVPHTYRAIGDEAATFYVFATPAGFERFYAEFSALLAAPGGPSPAEMVAVGEKHGIEFLPPQ